MKRIFPLKKGVFYSVVLILVLILAVLTKIAFSPTNKLPVKTITPTLTPTPISKTTDPCAPFPNDKSNTTCKKAIELAMEKYPGDIKSPVESQTDSQGIFTGPRFMDFKTVLKEVWVLKINLKKAIKVDNRDYNSIELHIIKDDGKLLVHSYLSGTY